MSEQVPQRRLAAILAADVVGYSRMIQADEAGTLAALKSRRTEILQPLVSKHHGRVIKVMGDGVLVEFASAVQAVSCAVALQEAMAVANEAAEGSRRVALRIGINLGDVMVEGGDLYGDGVNIAARLEALAEPESVVISYKVRQEVANKLEVSFDDLGEQSLKNIAEPIRVYRVTRAAADVAGSGVGKALRSSKPSIAVLPFTNLGGDKEQQYLSDGITEDIITALSRFSELCVIARHSSFQYRDKLIDVRRIGQELGVQYATEGSLRIIGNRVRITAQLLDAATGSHLWAESYDRDLKDIFSLLDELTQTIVASIFGRLVAISTIKAHHRPPTEQWNAYDLVLQAREHMQRLDLATAELLTQRAVELDPHFARAHATQARIYLDRFSDDCELKVLQEALTSAQKALSLDENDGFCQCIMGAVWLFMCKFDLADFHLEKAVTLNPNNTSFLSWRAQFLARCGRSEEALELLDLVRQRDPHRHAIYWANFVVPLLQQRRYEELIQTVDHLSSKPVWVRAYLAVAYVYLGKDQEARAEIAAIVRVQPGLSIGKFARAEAFKEPADLKHVLEGLRRAGLPE